MKHDVRRRDARLHYLTQRGKFIAFAHDIEHERHFGLQQPLDEGQKVPHTLLRLCYAARVNQAYRLSLVVARQR